jgi:7,8-dihydropterin-6-yl-methyl-4-(beta-D-ribofuranosyl)aminobenzene 5'-phosphate synthase
MTLRSAPLDQLDLIVLVDNETDTLSSIDPAVPQTSEVASLLRRTPPTRHINGADCVSVFDRLCVGCHGFSVLVTGQIGNDRRSVLFDVGPYGDAWVENSGRLGIDIAVIERIFLSHWHWDHSGALPVVIRAVTEARQKVGLDAPIVDVHPHRPDQRGIKAPSGVVVMFPEEPTFEAIREAGGALDTHEEPHLLGDGFFLGSGAIPRRTSYETGLEGHRTFRGTTATADPLIMDERFLCAEVRGRGVTVLSACSHAGVVNTCLAAQDHYAGTTLDVVLGGFHLAGAAVEQRIDATVADLADVVGPRIVAPGHCTGWRAKAALATRFAPAGYGPSAVGTRYLLTAPGPE